MMHHIQYIARYFFFLIQRVICRILCQEHIVLHDLKSFFASGVSVKADSITVFFLCVLHLEISALHTVSGFFITSIQLFLAQIDDRLKCFPHFFSYWPD